MHISKDSDNKFKQGRIWIYLTKSYDKNIGIEWSLRFNPLNLYLEMDGGERDYTFSFWFIFVFYIKFSNIFKYYPKEWNSCPNDGKGGYIESASRQIGISQYNMSLSLYLWHDGEDSWYPDKCDKIWYKYINMFDIFFGSWCYHTLEEKIYDDYIDLPEGRQKVNITSRLWHQKYNRFYMKPFNNKGKSITLESTIKYPQRKQKQEDLDNIKKYNFPPDELEREMKTVGFPIKETDDDRVALNIYKKKIMELRSCESIDWVPYEYRKNYYREQKLKRILE